VSKKPDELPISFRVDLSSSKVTYTRFLERSKRTLFSKPNIEYTSVESSLAEMVREVGRRHDSFRWAPVHRFVTTPLLAVVAIFAYVNHWSAFGAAVGPALLMGGVGLWISLSQVENDDIRRTTLRVVYEVDGHVRDRFEHIGQFFDHLAVSGEVAGSFHILNRPSYAGEIPIVKGEALNIWPLVLRRGNVPSFESNLSVRSVSTRGRTSAHSRTYFFLPDCILLRDSGDIQRTFSSLPYGPIRVATRPVPDQPFGYEIFISFGAGAAFNLLALDAQTALDAVSVLSSFAVLEAWVESEMGSVSTGEDAHKKGSGPGYANSQGRQQGQGGPGNQELAALGRDLLWAASVLGVGTDAPKDVVISRYRQLAVDYHPDMYATKPPEFRDLANRKMQEINAAYDLFKSLKGW
jgi:DnaJ-domain-containing protein 1